MLGNDQKKADSSRDRISSIAPRLGVAARLANIFDKVILVSLLAVGVISIIPYGTVDPWWDALFEVMVFGLAALWIVEGLLAGKWQIKGVAILLPMVVITVYIYVQTLPIPSGLIKVSGSANSLTIDRYQTQLTALKTLALTLFTALLLAHVTTRKRLMWTVRVVIGMGLGSALFGLLRHFLQAPDSANGFVLPFLFAGTGYAQFLSPNVFAFLMEM